MYLFQTHFRRDHILCEDDGCLAKKFIVFSTESELKVSTYFIFVKKIKIKEGRKEIKKKKRFLLPKVDMRSSENCVLSVCLTLYNCLILLEFA